jgi:hypothetical protein
MQAGWHQFPNGKVFEVDASGSIEGVIELPVSFDEGLESVLDRIADAMVGRGWLEDVSFLPRGGDRLWVRGRVDTTDEYFDPEEVTPLTFGSPAWLEAFARQHRLKDVEIQHAAVAGESVYDDETVFALPGDRDLRADAGPDGVSYARITVPGVKPVEVVHWTIDEVGEDPGFVLGALIGAALGAGEPA